jgi:hypothetical protein
MKRTTQKPKTTMHTILLNKHNIFEVEDFWNSRLFQILLNVAKVLTLY